MICRSDIQLNELPVHNSKLQKFNISQYKSQQYLDQTMQNLFLYICTSQVKFYISRITDLNYAEWTVFQYGCNYFYIRVDFPFKLEKFQETSPRWLTLFLLWFSLGLRWGGVIGFSLPTSTGSLGSTLTGRVFIFIYYKKEIIDTVKPVYKYHSREQEKWSLKAGGVYVQVPFIVQVSMITNF